MIGLVLFSTSAIIQTGFANLIAEQRRKTFPKLIAKKRRKNTVAQRTKDLAHQAGLASHREWVAIDNAETIPRCVLPTRSFVRRAVWACC